MKYNLFLNMMAVLCIIMLSCESENKSDGRIIQQLHIKKINIHKTSGDYWAVTFDQEGQLNSRVISQLSTLGKINLIVIDDIGISNNMLSGLSELKELKRLRLFGLEKQKEINWHFLKGLINLQELSILNFPLRDKDCQFIGKLISLQDLAIANNNLAIVNNKISDGCIPRLSTLKKLENLSINVNNVQNIATIRKTILSLPALKLIDLNKTGIMEPEVEKIVKEYNKQYKRTANNKLEWEPMNIDSLNPGMG